MKTPPMPSNTSHAKPYDEVLPTDRRNWIAILFLILSPVAAAVAATLYVAREGFVAFDLFAFLAMYTLTGMSITVGYHRYYSHKAFECHPAVRFLVLVFGAASVQNTVLAWSSNHRYHHQFTDKEGDPYSIKRGFFWAHMGWMFYQEAPNRPYRNVPDLKKDRLALWQHRHYPLIAVTAGFLLPTLVGALYGRPFAGFLWGGLVRMVVSHQVTFMINSVAHTLGKRTYSREATARNNAVLALLSFGEGYHSFHHEFPSDYRNGISWYDFDPGKWVIGALSWFGATRALKRTPASRIVRA